MKLTASVAVVLMLVRAAHVRRLSLGVLLGAGCCVWTDAKPRNMALLMLQHLHLYPGALADSTASYSTYLAASMADVGKQIATPNVALLLVPGMRLQRSVRTSTSTWCEQAIREAPNRVLTVLEADKQASILWPQQPPTGTLYDWQQHEQPPGEQTRPDRAAIHTPEGINASAA